MLARGRIGWCGSGGLGGIPVTIGLSIPEGARDAATFASLPSVPSPMGDREKPAGGLGMKRAISLVMDEEVVIPRKPRLWQRRGNTRRGDLLTRGCKPTCCKGGRNEDSHSSQ